jgi:predicted nucleotidyltransferase
MLKQMIKESLSISGVVNIARSVYVFGSFLNSKTPQDLDVLLVYEAHNTQSCKLAIAFRETLTSIVESKLDISADVILLSISEEEEMQFVVQESACMVWSSHFDYMD